MAYNFEYPYTDISRFNADWIINRVKELSNEWLSTRKEVDDFELNFEELKAYVNNYFNNLDISAEVNAKLEEMRANGELEAIISKYLNNDVINQVNKNTADINTINTKLNNMDEDSTVKYIFIGGSIEAPTYSTNFMIYNNEGYIFDFGYQRDCAYLRTTLKNYGISKIKGIIISHYHDDHIGDYATSPTDDGTPGINAFLNDSYFDFTACTAYLPHNDLSWDRMVGDFNDIHNSSLAIINAFNNRNINIIYPVENQKIEIADNFSFVFNNLSSIYFNSYYNYYYDQAMVPVSPERTCYNNFSMILTVNHFNNKFIYPGDVQELAQGYNYACLKDVKMNVTSHHSVNWYANEKWLKNLHPEITIANIARPARYYTNVELSTCIGCSSNTLCTGDNGYIEINSNKEGYNLIKGEPMITNGTDNKNYQGQELLGGVDLNNIITPGVYNYAYQTGNKFTETMLNRPFDINSNFTLYVDYVTNQRVIRQIAVSTEKSNEGEYNSTRIGIRFTKPQSVANMNNPPEWNLWQYLVASRAIRSSSLNTYFSYNSVTNYSTQYSRINYINGTLTITFDLRATTEVTSNTAVLDNSTFEVSLHPVTERRFFFLAYGNGKPISMYLKITPEGNISLHNYEVISSGTIFYGTVTVTL